MQPQQPKGARDCDYYFIATSGNNAPAPTHVVVPLCEKQHVNDK